jgi:hypothetical protein
VKFGVIYNTGHHGVDPDTLIAVARHAEDRGFESACCRSSAGDRST